MPKRNSSCNLSQYVWRSAICDLAAACSRALANNNKMNAMGGGSQSVSACCQNMPGRLIHATEQAVADALAMAFREQVKAGFCQAPVCVHHMRTEHRQEIATPEMPPTIRPDAELPHAIHANMSQEVQDTGCSQAMALLEDVRAVHVVLPRTSCPPAGHSKDGHLQPAVCVPPVAWPQGEDMWRGTCGNMDKREGHAATWTRERVGMQT